jgi:hypothetical protein
MKNLWPESFEENTKPSAKQLLEEQANLLSKLTGGIVFAEVTAIEPPYARSMSILNDFVFRFNIKGKFLDDYSFNVLTFSHDITLYPVEFRLDEKIGRELDILKSAFGYTVSIEAPEKLEEFLSRVFNTERVKSVIGSIIRLSK